MIPDVDECLPDNVGGSGSCDFYGHRLIVLADSTDAAESLSPCLSI
jgi:hypothetical protein